MNPQQVLGRREVVGAGWEPSEGGWLLSVTFNILISLFLLVLVCLYVGFLRHVGSILVLIHENFVL